MKSDRKPIKVWSTYSPTSFGQYASLHDDMDVAEYDGFEIM